MSEIVELLLDRIPPSAAANALATFVTLSGYSAPIHQYGAFRFREFPIAEHVRNKLPSAITDAVKVCLSLDEQVVEEWSAAARGRSPHFIQLSIGDLHREIVQILKAVSTWVVCVESNNGPQYAITECLPDDVPHCVDSYFWAGDAPGYDGMILFAPGQPH